MPRPEQQPFIRPDFVLQARLVPGHHSEGTASLAKGCFDLLRESSRRLPGSMAMQALSPAGQAHGRRVQWSLRAWPRESVEAAWKVLSKALATGIAGWRSTKLHVIETRPCPAALLNSAGEDLCLRFETPLRFWIDASTRAPTVLDAATLMRLISQRCESLTGLVPRWLHDDPMPVVLGQFGHLDVQGSARGRRTVQFQGPLLIRGASAALVDALWNLQFCNLVQNQDGDAMAWRGAFRLHLQRDAWLDHALLKRPRLAMAAERLIHENDVAPVLASGGKVMDAVQMADTLLARWRSGSTDPQPAEAFDLLRPGHAPRRVERLATLDLLTQQHVLRVLTPSFERLFDPHSFGFRPGRGRLDAIEAIRSSLRDGFGHVVESDISQCFPSIDHGKLMRLLDDVLPRGDRLMRDLLSKAITQPFLYNGAQHDRAHGLAQGSPLSPLLTNLMLTRLDRALDPDRFRWVRYADDFVVLTRSRADAQEALSVIRHTLGEDGLRLAEHKTRVAHLQSGFSFLGERFGPDTLEALPIAEPAQRKPMVVAEPYLQLGVNGDALEVRRQGRMVGLWPLRRLSELLILGPATFSSALVERCQRMDVPIAVAQAGQNAVSVVTAGRRRFHAQQFAHGLWHAGLSDSARLALAKEVLDAKLCNQATLVDQRRGHVELVRTLTEARQQAGGSPDIASARGHEGRAARLYFQWMRDQIVATQRPHFSAPRRARGGPDRLNALLNFAYFLLCARVSGFARLMALDPYLGWLHQSDEDYECLVYDLMEPFRPFVDRIVLRMINRLELRSMHFDDGRGQWRLTSEARRIVIDRFEHGFGERVQGVPLRELLWAQVRSVRQLCSGQGSIWVFRWSPRELLGNSPEPCLLTLDAPAG